MTRTSTLESAAPPHRRLHGPVLLIGGTGMLGRAWRDLLSKHDVDFDTPPRSELDLTRPDTLAKHITGEHPTIINCSAWTDVDGAETKLDEAKAANGTGVGALAERSGRVNATLVHYSTDYVFNGNATSPYALDHPLEPVNAYGESKLLGETLLQRSGCRYLLIRTSWLYAPWGKNFVRTIANLAKTKPSLKIVADQRGRPTSSEHLADLSFRLLQSGAAGIFHGCDGGECTWFDFAREITARVNPGCDVEPCTTADFPRPAKRPTYSVLSLERTEAEIGPMPDWRDNLRSVLDRLE